MKDMENLNTIMRIINYPISLVSELGERNPVERVGKDLSMFLTGMKAMRQERRPSSNEGINPVVGKTFSDIEKKYRPYSVKKVHPIRPNDHYLEIMQLKGWLDLDLDDPDLKPLLK